jgi:hypothetical protein
VVGSDGMLGDRIRLLRHKHTYYDRFNTKNNDMAKNKTINVKGTEITIVEQSGQNYISLTDMLKAKDGEYFISDWLRNRNTIEFLGIWESVYNPNFNYGEFDIIKSQAGLNSYRLSDDLFGITAKQWQDANP